MYEIFGFPDEIEKLINLMKSQLGEPFMVYFPDQTIYKASFLDSQILSLLSKRPRAKSKDIAHQLKIGIETVRRRIRFLTGNLIKVIPIIDLPKSNIVMFSIFSKHVDITRSILRNHLIWEFSDANAGIFVSSTTDFGKAKKLIDFVRRKEIDAEVMMIYNYELPSYYKLFIKY